MARWTWRDGEGVGLELVGVEEDADLPLAGAGQGHLAHPVHRLQHPLHLLVGDLAGLPQAARARHHHRDHGIGVGIGLLDHRRQDVRGKVAQRPRDLLAHVLGGVGDVALEEELHRDAGRALGGHGLQLVEAGQAGERLLDGHDHLGGDLLGSGPGQADRDVDGGGIGAGKEIDPEVAEGEDAEGDQEADQHHREDGTTDAELGETHGYCVASTGAPSTGSWPSAGTATCCFASSPATISTSSPVRSPTRTSFSFSTWPSTANTL